jgi:hypothetical protein
MARSSNVVIPGLWSTTVSTAQLPATATAPVPAPSDNTCVRIQVTLRDFPIQIRNLSPLNRLCDHRQRLAV